ELANLALGDILPLRLLRGKRKVLRPECAAVLVSHIGPHAVRIAQAKEAEALPRRRERCGKPGPVGDLERVRVAAERETERVALARRVAELGEVAEAGSSVVRGLVVRLLRLDGVSRSGCAEVEHIAADRADRPDGGEAAICRVVAPARQVQLATAAFGT